MAESEHCDAMGGKPRFHCMRNTRRSGRMMEGVAGAQILADDGRWSGGNSRGRSNARRRTNGVSVSTYEWFGNVAVTKRSV